MLKPKLGDHPHRALIKIKATVATRASIGISAQWGVLMMQRSLSAGAMTLLVAVLIAPPFSQAQTRDSSLQEIRSSIVQSIGIDATAVEVSIKGNVVIVARVNSDLNQADHSTRDNEASRIAPIVSKAFADKPEFKSIHTIRVVYIVRTKPNSTTKIIDTVDFRKAPDGGFVFHAT